MKLRPAKKLLLLPPLILSSSLACSSEDSGTPPTPPPLGMSGGPSGSGGASGGANGGTGGMILAAGTGGVGTGGLPSSGGSGGSAPSTGGSGGKVVAMGGAPPVAGSGGSSTGGTPPAAGSGGMPPTGSCTFEVTPSVSKTIPTVGIVEFKSTAANPTAARIEFGLDTSYGMTAPVDLTAANYRTLLLGMKAARTYHYRIVATSDGQECASQDYTIQTGALATGLPDLDVTTSKADAVAPGFLVTAQYQGVTGGGGQRGLAYILDKDGDYVWWYFVAGTTDLSRAAMSFDGKHMWMSKANVPSGSAKVVRVAMDGSGEEDFSTQFKGQNHDFVVLPDETVAFIAYDNGCDKISLRAPNGTVRDVINSGEVVGATMCHCNALQYSPEDQTLVVSELNTNTYFKVKLTGELVWKLGGNQSDFTGEGANWDRQHGLDLLGTDRLVIFNNGGMAGGAGSLAIEIKLDLTAKTAARVWTYSAMPAIRNSVMGDVQRLDNGNTMITYSTQGILYEVDSSSNIVQSIEWPIGGAVGYSMKRTTLYGPPPE
jgi:hypothetical protein